MNFETFETERLELRKWITETYDQIYRVCSKLEQIKLLGLESENQLTEEKRKYEQGFSTFNKKYVNFQLIQKEGKQVLGWCTFHTWYIDHRRAEIGYWLLKEEFKNKGHLSEAIPTVLAFGFNEMSLNRVEAFVSPENKASLRIMEKFGFKKEGYLRQHYMNNGNLDDSVLFSLLKQDYSN